MTAPLTQENLQEQRYRIYCKNVKMCRGNEKYPQKDKIKVTMINMTME